MSVVLVCGSAKSSADVVAGKQRLKINGAQKLLHGSLVTEYEHY